MQLDAIKFLWWWGWRKGQIHNGSIIGIHPLVSMKACFASDKTYLDICLCNVSVYFLLVSIKACYYLEFNAL